MSNCAEIFASSAGKCGSKGARRFTRASIAGNKPSETGRISGAQKMDWLRAGIALRVGSPARSKG